MSNTRFNTLASIWFAGALVVLGAPALASADQTPGAAPQGCTFVATSNIEL